MQVFFFSAKEWAVMDLQDAMMSACFQSGFISLAAAFVVLLGSSRSLLLSALAIGAIMVIVARTARWYFTYLQFKHNPV